MICSINAIFQLVELQNYIKELEGCLVICFVFGLIFGFSIGFFVCFCWVRSMFYKACDELEKDNEVNNGT